MHQINALSTRDTKGFGFDGSISHADMSDVHRIIRSGGSDVLSSMWAMTCSVISVVAALNFRNRLRPKTPFRKQTHRNCKGLTHANNLFPIVITEVAVERVPPRTWTHFFGASSQWIDFYPSLLRGLAVRATDAQAKVEGECSATGGDMSR